MRCGSAVIVGVLCQVVAAAGNCERGDCRLVEDDVSLVQVRQSLKSADERAPMASSPAEKLGEVEAMEKLLNAGLQESQNEDKDEDEVVATASKAAPKEVAEESAAKGVPGDEFTQVGLGQMELRKDFASGRVQAHARARRATALEAQKAQAASKAKTGVFVEERTGSLPAGCSGSVYCIGTRPWCGGNEEDCTTKGMSVVGWTKKCNGEWVGCASGWKVRCAYCGATAVTVAAPTPAPILPEWVYPAPPPPPPPAPVVTVLTPVMPAFALPSYSYRYNEYAMGNASAVLKSSLANLTGLKARLCNATELIKKVEKNITLFEQKEKKAHGSALKARQAAVRYAKKSVLANITLMKAMRSLDDAYMAQTGASNHALRMTAVSTNSRLRKVYYKKLLIEKKEELKRAEEALRIGKISVNSATQSIHQAKKFTERNRRQEKALRKRASAFVKPNMKLAEDNAVKHAMEEAYAAASPMYGAGDTLKRDLSNVPSWGKWDWGVTGLNSYPSCECAGVPGCECANWKKVGGAAAAPAGI
jgi:hypothetical protein